MKTPSIALVGDYSPKVPAHQAIPRAFELIRAETGLDVTWRWVGTQEVRDAACDLAEFSAVWLVPASPYKNMDGALAAVRWRGKLAGRFSARAGVFSMR